MTVAELDDYLRAIRALPFVPGHASVKRGALDLRTRIGRAATGERWRLTLGGGSYGARALRVRFGDGDPDVDRGVTASLGYAGATGDYRFFDDGGTMLAPDDDRVVATGTRHGCPAPATSKCVSPAGAFDLSGNLREWTSTPVSGAFRVRGGGFDNIEQGLTCDLSFIALVPGFAFNNLGFRCCSDTP